MGAVLFQEWMESAGWRIHCETANCRCSKYEILLLFYKEPSGKSAAGVMAEFCDFPWVKMYKSLIELIIVFH